jgi:hypothetical protein
MIDNRFNYQDFVLAKAETIQEYQTLVNKLDESQFGFMRLNMLINKLYALRHGYELYLSDMTEYQDFLKEYPNRHPVWLKPNFILDILNTKPQCQWVAFMDSDAHFWMDRHGTSLDDYFATASMMEASLSYEEFEYQKRKRRGYYPWIEQQIYFIIGMNGIYENGREIGWPLPIHSNTSDPGCAGVVLVRNCNDGKKMIHEWIYGPENASKEILGQYEHFAKAWAREQSVLNRIVIPLHSQHTAFYSFRDFVDPDNSVIRHIWTDWRKGRVHLGKKVLEILLSDQ